MKKFAFLTSLGLVAALASSCSNPTNYEGKYDKIISPSGAPAIIFYDEAIQDNFETNSIPSNVGAQLQQNNYGVVVFDFLNGLKSIETNNGPYKLARIITGGNLYLVGIGEDNSGEPTKDDYIVSFGENLLPDRVYKHIYSDDVVSATHYVSGVSDVGPILKTGLHAGNEVDYVVIAQPALYSITSQMSEEERKSLTITSIREKWGEVTSLPAIFPQAGLFINTNMYEVHKAYFDVFLDNVDDYITTCIESPEDMKNGIESIGDSNTQVNKYGFTAQVAYNVQLDNNGFALVDNETNETLDIASFLAEIEEDTSLVEHIM